MQILSRVIYCISPCTAFIVQDDISGVIPNLRIERRGIPGGKSTVDVHNLSQYNSIWHMVDGIQNEDMLNVSGRKNYTLHQATLILEATTLVDNGLGYKIIFMVNEKLYDKPTGLDNDARASKGTFLDSQQSTMNDGTGKRTAYNFVLHDAMPISAAPQIFHCRAKRNKDGYGKCYIQVAKLFKDHALHVKKWVCVKVKTDEP